MKHLFTLIFVIIIFVCACFTAPVDDKDTNNKDSKSAFGQAFDEIVVESHLTVRRKSNSRQAKAQNSTTETPVIKTKREIRPLRPFSASAANSQSQAFNSFGPLGSFGASASSSQSQNFGPNGIAAGFSGTQQYHFNGQTINIAFGSGFANRGAVVTITGPDGKKRTNS